MGWFRSYGPVRLYSVLRCCSVRFVHIAPVPTLSTLGRAVTMHQQHSEAGHVLDPQLSDVALQTLAPNDHRWFCAPVQPEFCNAFKFRSDKLSVVEEGTTAFNYTPVGFL